MATSTLRFCIILFVFLCVANGQSTTSDWHCSYTFNVAATDCRQSSPVNIDLLQNSIVALQEQVKILASDNIKLRQEISTIKSVEGYCRGVPAGHVYVAWNVGDCITDGPYKKEDYNIGDSYTGWVATVRIIVEEIGIDEADIVIVSDLRHERTH